MKPKDDQWFKKAFETEANDPFYVEVPNMEGQEPSLRLKKGTIVVDSKGVRLPEKPSEGAHYERHYHGLKARCVLCAKEYTIRKQMGGSTSWNGPKKHLSRVHQVTSIEDLKAIMQEKGTMDMPRVDSATTMTVGGIERFFQFTPPNSREWNRNIEALAKMVVVDNLPLRFGERVGFVKFMRSVVPNWPRIGATSLKRKIVQMSKDMHDITAKQLADIHRETDISWTADIWSSGAKDPYLTYTAHWINADWRMCWKVLATDPFPLPHNAMTISHALMRTRSEMGVRPRDPKTGEVLDEDTVQANEEVAYDAEAYFDRPSITTDCGSDISAGVERSARFDWNRCMCHVLHNTVVAALKVEPVKTAVQQLKKLGLNCKRSGLTAQLFMSAQTDSITPPSQEDIDLDSSDVEQWRLSLPDEDSDDAIDMEVREEAALEEETQKGVEKCAGQSSISKGRCRPLKLFVPGETRWGSTYQMIKRGLRLRMAITTFMAKAPLKSIVERRNVENATDDLEVEKRKLFHVSFTPETWTVLEQVCSILEKLHMASKEFESSEKCTISQVLPMCIALLYDLLPAELENAPRLQDFIEVARVKLISFLDDKNQLYNWALASGLDPRFAHTSWLEPIWQHPQEWLRVCRTPTNENGAWSNVEHLIDEVNTEMVCMLVHYERGTAVATEGQPCGRSHERPRTTATGHAAPCSIFFGSHMKRAHDLACSPSPSHHAKGDATVRARTAVTTWRETVTQPLYHTTEIFTKDPLDWWRDHQAEFPAIAKLARRRLCVQASSAQSERAFSKAGKVVAPNRRSLGPDTVKHITGLAWHLVQCGWGPEELNAEKKPGGMALTLTRAKVEEQTMHERQHHQLLRDAK